jgi:uncharacterized protein YacL
MILIIILPAFYKTITIYMFCTSWALTKWWETSRAEGVPFSIKFGNIWGTIVCQTIRMVITNLQAHFVSSKLAIHGYSIWKSALFIIVTFGVIFTVFQFIGKFIIS